MDTTIDLTLNCYLCRKTHAIAIQPIDEQRNGDGTITLFYSDTVFFSCPVCGQKYAIPNSQQRITLRQQKAAGQD